MSNPLSNRRERVVVQSSGQYLADLEAVWEKQDKQLAFDQLMNRMKRGLVAVEEINRIPKRWQTIAFERGFIKMDDSGGWVPRQIKANQYTTPWQDQRHVVDRAKQRMFMRQMLSAQPASRAA